MNFNKEIRIGNKNVSDSDSVYIIAEAGVNHNGNFDAAVNLIDIAAEAGADAVKFQAFKTENLILKDVKKANYQTENTSGEESQFDMLKKLELTMEQNQKLLQHCMQKGIDFITTPFDEESADELEDLDLPAYKIASTDLTNIPFLKKIAQKGKPLILSTGMSYLAEVQLALEAIYPYNKDVILLQCSANYPIDDSDANLRVIHTYLNLFDMLVGYSDHSVGIGASPYAVPMGAKVIEKHFTNDKTNDGPDHKASLSPEELKSFVKQIRKVEEYLGTGVKYPSTKEQANRKALQKNLVAAKTIRKGDVFTVENIIARRTGGEGISPIYFDKLVGKKANSDYNVNDIIHE